MVLLAKGCVNFPYNVLVNIYTVVMLLIHGRSFMYILMHEVATPVTVLAWIFYGCPTGRVCGLGCPALCLLCGREWSEIPLLPRAKCISLVYSSVTLPFAITLTPRMTA